MSTFVALISHQLTYCKKLMDQILMGLALSEGEEEAGEGKNVYQLLKGQKFRKDFGMAQQNM